jgi:hypothetical protein
MFASPAAFLAADATQASFLPLPPEDEESTTGPKPRLKRPTAAAPSQRDIYSTAQPSHEQLIVVP